MGLDQVALIALLVVFLLDVAWMLFEFAMLEQRMRSALWLLECELGENTPGRIFDYD